MKKRVLISGCSFTENFIQFDPMHWTYNAFPQDVYVVNNVARGAAGNNYIASSILSNIDLNSKPDYVFILWSGIRRIDMPFPSGTSTTKFKNYLFCAVNNECQFVDYFMYTYVIRTSRFFKTSNTTLKVTDDFTS